MHPLDRFYRLVLPVGGLAVAATVAGVGWFTQPDRWVRGYAPAQPLPFSHELHAGTLRMDCAYCHSGAARSRVAGVPDLETCMGCHRVTRQESPAIRELARRYQTGETLPWQRLHHLPDHVYFDHRPHVEAGIQCQTCHGEVQAMKVTERRMSMRMGNCLACHRNPQGALPPGAARVKGAEHCAACHR